MYSAIARLKTGEGRKLEAIAPDARNICLVRATQPSRQFGQCVEHGLQIEGRAADNLEHIGGGGLLLQRFGQIVGACLHLVEQPHVLDGDCGLVGERFY